MGDGGSAIVRHAAGIAGRGIDRGDLIRSVDRQPGIIKAGGNLRRTEIFGLRHGLLLVPACAKQKQGDQDGSDFPHGQFIP
jgi:hypothetical protein